MREDIQCLRGIAIFQVLLYHLYPSLFVNGFLGVDIFFVISGYLMGRTLTHKNIESYQDILKFYYRRFKRILPLYYLILIFSLLAVQFCLGDFWWPTNHRYFKSALLLSTNQQLITDSADYFNEFQADSSSMNLFIHTWSLGVEIQFYLIVPFIFLALQYFKNDHQKLLTTVAITFLGFFGFSIINPKISFNFMPCRLWQFSAGFIALLWLKRKNEHKGYKVVHCEELETKEIDFPEPGGLFNEQKVMMMSWTIILSGSLPFEINIMVLRPLVTLATAHVIAINLEDDLFSKLKSLSYIGNISYVIYLVHWPIITIFNSYFVHSHIICVAATLLLSILLHELFEKQYLKLEWRSIIPLVLMLIMANVALQYSAKNSSFWSKNYPLDVQKIINDNQAGQKYIWKVDPETEECASGVISDKIDRDGLLIFGDCRYSGVGKLSIMMIGNSYTMNFEKYFRAQFRQNYSDWRYMALSENNAIYGDTLLSNYDLEVSKIHVEMYKPDVLIIMSRYSNKMLTPIQSHDDLLLEINESLAFYQKFVKKIYILDVHPLYNMNFLNKFLHYVTRQRNDIAKLHLDRKTADETMKNGAERLQRANCEKCRLFGLGQAFVEGDKYLTFDNKTMLSYIDNTMHITPAGIKMCDPVFESLTREMLSTV